MPCAAVSICYNRGNEGHENRPTERIDGLWNRRQFASRPLCAKQAVVQGEKYRITVLTARLFRLEYSEDGVFEDRPTQCVLNRDFPVPQFRVFETDGSLKIVTEGVVLLYDKQKFSPAGCP